MPLMANLSLAERERCMALLQQVSSKALSLLVLPLSF
eukprot:SAG22_NODE_20193_length_267_cov_1.541667_2_plen_37_part_01